MATVEHCLYCFEALAANLENRNPMTLYQVQASWASYPKGLDSDDEDHEPHSFSSSCEDLPGGTNTASTSSNNNIPRPRIPALQRVTHSSRSTSTSSTPSSNSTSTTSLSAVTGTTTPENASNSFVPVGLHPRRTSQRSSTLTESPLFVTWNTLSSSSLHSRNLRGCIGTFASEPLSSGLRSFALASALQDDRFAPISYAELPTLEVSVTLLTDFETCASPLDWEIGVHGIRISFYARNKRYGACYLPDVAVEQDWDKEETVVSAMRKAGWGGRKEKWTEVGDLKVTRFQGKAESVGWEEFKRWREWVDKGKEGGK